MKICLPPGRSSEIGWRSRQKKKKKTAKHSTIPATHDASDNAIGNRDNTLCTGRVKVDAGVTTTTARSRAAPVDRDRAERTCSDRENGASVVIGARERNKNKQRKQQHCERSQRSSNEIESIPRRKRMIRIHFHSYVFVCFRFLLSFTFLFLHIWLGFFSSNLKCSDFNSLSFS